MTFASGLILQKKIKRRIVKVFNRRIYPKIQYKVGKLKGDNVVYTFYTGTNSANFGDLLTPDLLRKYYLRPILTPIGDAELVVVGSILQRLPKNFSGYIVGSGLIKDVSRRFPGAKILALRGHLTRERIGAPLSTVLGDPGLLADKLITKRQKKQFVLGIVPHFQDKSDKRVQNIYQRNKKNVLIIDVQRKPEAVISDIDKCAFIISSSLHGIVVSDSLGIPNAWVVLSDKVKGNGFKFFDYASAFNMKIESQFLTGDESLVELTKMTHEVYENIQGVKNDLDSVFNRLNHELLERNKNSRTFQFLQAR